MKHLFLTLFAVAALAAPAAALADGTPSTPAGGTAKISLADRLQRFEQRLDTFQARLEQAKDRCAKADSDKSKARCAKIGVKASRRVEQGA